MKNGSKVQRKDETTLIAEAKAGNAESFEQLVRLHADRLYASILRLVGNPKEAEEASQEAFLRAWRSIGRFQERSGFFTWLYRIGINEAKRRIERRPREELTIDSGEEVAAASIQSAPDRKAEGDLQRSRLVNAINTLGLDYRAPLVLRDVEGRSVKEGAEIMGIGVPAFKSRLHRARLAVREEIQDLLEES